jgi:hypothetical protein
LNGFLSLFFRQFVNELKQPIRKRQVWIHQKYPWCIITLRHQPGQDGICNGCFARSAAAGGNTMSIWLDANQQIICHTFTDLERCLE